MRRRHQIRSASGLKSRPGRPTTTAAGANAILVYGWDSRTETWHGPNELGSYVHPDQRLLHALQSAPGKSWYGPVRCCSCGEPATRFFSFVHDLADCAIASIYCDESKTGPAEILAVIPSERRLHLRDEFAFEFVAFVQFLGTISAGTEFKLQESIASAVAEQKHPHPLVFSISTGLWPRNLEYVLSLCVEKVAVTVCHWLNGPPFSGRTGRGSICAA
jgi:hypothetical protein